MWPVCARAARAVWACVWWFRGSRGFGGFRVVRGRLEVGMFVQRFFDFLGKFGDCALFKELFSGGIDDVGSH